MKENYNKKKQVLPAGTKYCMLQRMSDTKRRK